MVGLLAALLAFGMSSAPGWRELRWFALCAALAALFNLSNVLVTLRAPEATVLLLSRICLCCGGLHAAAWFKYSAEQQRRDLNPYERVVVGVGVVLSLASLVPNVVLSDRLYTREVAWLGITYADAPPTRFGEFAFLYHAAGLSYLFVRYARARARGDRDSTAQCVAIGAVLLGAIHDALASAGVIRTPYILDVGNLVLVLAVGGSLTRNFVTSARALEVSSRRLDVAQQELVKRERLAALGELAAVVAHEVRNPLAVVFNATASLRKAKLGGDDHQRLLDIVQEEADRLRDIVSDLLEFARPRPPQMAPATLSEVVSAAIAAARDEVGAAEDAVSLEVGGEVRPLVCDERLVRQAVINLVTNALQAPGRRTAVRVRVERDHARDEESVLIRVADDGEGVAEELRERVFTPFFSARPTGTGLGLAVVRSSVEAHGGDVALTTTPGGGATFTIRLPRRERAAAKAP
jgi:two-component system sensor histidine kinase HydH